LKRQGVKNSRTRNGTSRGRSNGKTLAASRDRRMSFPARMPMGQFLFDYLHHRGVQHSFGIPGDFALSTFSWLDRSPIQQITMCHEPGAGFAADAYARLNGIGLVCVTYCVGGLNALNPIAGAYAEKSPVVVVSGAPGRKEREKDPLVHHKVKTFDTQRRVYEEVTVATTVLLDEQRAAAEIVRCVEACLRHKRPVYIEVPHDMVDREIPVQVPEIVPEPPSDPQALEAALQETMELIAGAKKPIILAGVELQRFGVANLAIELAERLNIPIAADMLSKATVRENHPLYLGVYGGAMSSDSIVREYVESADCVLMLGTFITDMSMGIYTAKLDRSRSVLATTESIKVRFHRYDDVRFVEYLQKLARCDLAAKKFKHPQPHAEPEPLTNSERPDSLTMADFFRIVSLHLDERYCVAADVGDAMFGAVGIRTSKRADFLGPAYYMSMGFAVPAAVGIAAARPNVRPIVMVGDGAFQMTGTELSTALRLGQTPIILILNNDGYGTMRQIRDGRFNLITSWNYGKICDLIGGGVAEVASTKGELDSALTRAQENNELRVIEVRIPRDDRSLQLANLSVEINRMRK
jgi:indolepyruvate decarboxylase